MPKISLLIFTLIFGCTRSYTYDVNYMQRMRRYEPFNQYHTYRPFPTTRYTGPYQSFSLPAVYPSARTRIRHQQQHTIEYSRNPKFQDIYNEIAHEPLSSLMPELAKNRKKIIMLHDYFRTRVKPEASNMLAMRWHSKAALQAQQWANQCKYLTHTPEKGRTVHNYGTCGQNIFVSSHKAPWWYVLRRWFEERKHYKYGSDDNTLFLIGHYTQMVWAATHRVGCGLTKCSSGGPNNKPFYNYVCNYCPSGNLQGKLGTPYEIGLPCSSCPDNCRSNKIQLCENACPYVNEWSNCEDLLDKNPQWICGNSTMSKKTPRHYCMATCSCHNRIYD